jgi:transcriptional repressor NrdR
MKCPFCNFEDSRVVDSRVGDGGETIRRRRECPECGGRFSTFERLALSVMVVKKDGRREEFDREKLFRNMWKACAKRGLAVKDVEDIAREIEQKVSRSGAQEVQSTQIGEYAMDGLRQLDHIAYIRFASVYKEFRDLEEMRGEMERLKAS